MLLLTKYTVLYKENEICCIILLSLPSRERGLKLTFSARYLRSGNVAPFAGAWIEMIKKPKGQFIYIVAPFAGAWIEILAYNNKWDWFVVAPFAGAWIEISRQ